MSLSRNVRNNAAALAGLNESASGSGQVGAKEASVRRCFTPARRVQQLLDAARERAFFGRRRQQQAVKAGAAEMLDTPLPGESRSGGARTDRKVARNGKAVLPCPGDHGSVRIRRYGITDLDEVDAGSMQIVDGGPGRLRAIDALDERQLERQRPLQDRSRGKEPRAARRRRPPTVPQGQNLIEWRRHVADAGYAVRDEGRPGPRSPVEPAEVDVHVPQTGDEKLAGCIDGFGAGWNDRTHTVNRADGRDSFAGDDHRHAGLCRGAGTVDDRDVLQQKRRFGRRVAETSERQQSEDHACATSGKPQNRGREDGTSQQWDNRLPFAHRNL